MRQKHKRTGHATTVSSKRRNQPAIKDKRGRTVTRINVSAMADPRIRAAVESDAIRWNCSYGWIVSSALAAFYGIDILRPNEGRKRR